MKIERTWFAADKTESLHIYTLFQTSFQTHPQIQRFDEHFVLDIALLMKEATLSWCCCY